jgi:hypothetical protein
MLPFTEPTAYGLGKSGWVSAKFEKGETLPVELFKAWIDESYRAQAPKKLVASLSSSGGASTSKAKPAARKSPARRSRPKR